MHVVTHYTNLMKCGLALWKILRVAGPYKLPKAAGYFQITCHLVCIVNNKIIMYMYVICNLFVGD